MLFSLRMLCVVVMGWAPASQQSPPAISASISGVVRDQTGAVLPGAAVEVLNDSAAVVRTAVTDANGTFRIEPVPRGSYSVRVHFPGFRDTTVPLRVTGTRPPTPLVVVLDL